MAWLPASDPEAALGRVTEEARTFQQLLRGGLGLLRLLQSLLSGSLLAFWALVLVLTLHSVQGSRQGLRRTGQRSCGAWGFHRRAGTGLAWERSLPAPVAHSDLPRPLDPEAQTQSQRKFWEGPETAPH